MRRGGEDAGDGDSAEDERRRVQQSQQRARLVRGERGEQRRGGVGVLRARGGWRGGVGGGCGVVGAGVGRVLGILVIVELVKLQINSGSEIIMGASNTANAVSRLPF